LPSVEGKIVHSSKELTSDKFAFSVAGRQSSFGELFLGFDQRDRLGIVSRSAGGALGASALIMATITAFYDLERARAETFFRYPDYFLFHVGASIGPYGMLDIWPDHKEVGVPVGDPEALLCAINDRAITHLLVEDGPTGTPAFGRATLGSIGVRHALAFAPNGRVRAGDVAVTGNSVTERYVAAVLDALAPLADDDRAALRARRAALLDNGVAAETCRRLTIDEALALSALPTG
jgi:hypothetical protein